MPSPPTYGGSAPNISALGGAQPYNIGGALPEFRQSSGNTYSNLGSDPFAKGPGSAPGFAF